MSPTLSLALFLQVAAIVVLRLRLGRMWLRRPTVMLLVAAVGYHGISEALLSISSIRVWDFYRVGVDQRYIDEASLIISAGLLALALGYVSVRPDRAAAHCTGMQTRTVSRILDWRIITLLCAPLAVFTYQGRGYNGSVAMGATATPKDLASTFLIGLVSLATLSFLVRYGIKWFVWALGAQSILLGAAGERTPIVVAGVTLLVLLAQLGLRPTRKHIGVALVLTITAILGITGYRAVSGRALYHEDTGLLPRVRALGSGLNTLAHTSAPEGSSSGLITQLAVRFDGNAFAGAVRQDMDSGHPALGFGFVAESLLLVVPSAVWPSKVTHSVGLNPTLTAMNEFDLQNINFLPTLPGLYLGFLGPFWLIVFLAVTGILCGWGERWLFGRFTVARLVVLASAIQAALSYEMGLPGMLVALRTGAVLGIAAKLLEIVLRLASGSRHPVPAESSAKPMGASRVC